MDLQHPKERSQPKKVDVKGKYGPALSFEAHGHPDTLVTAREIMVWASTNGAQPRTGRPSVLKPRKQDPYSIRCAPLVHGAVAMELRQCEEILNCEINNSNDNPLLLPEEEMVISCGNFHALHPG